MNKDACKNFTYLKSSNKKKKKEESMNEWAKVYVRVRRNDKSTK